MFLRCIQLAGANKPIALAQANAVLSRIDLLCEVSLLSSCHWLLMVDLDNLILYLCLLLYICLMIPCEWTKLSCYFLGTWDFSHSICNFEDTCVFHDYDFHLLSHLLPQIAGASLFGILLSRYDPVTCLKLAAGLMICTLPIVVCLWSAFCFIFHLVKF